jgi:serine/threonine protein kinase
LKAIRKHRIFEADEYDCVQSEREILILSRQYPFIIRLFAVFHDFQRVYFLLEHASCGNFYDFLSRLTVGFDNECIQWFSGQIICAIRFLHSNLIVSFHSTPKFLFSPYSISQIHRDLKPENVLLIRDGHIKLADFGFSKQLRSANETARTFCGTAEYIAPEVYQYFEYSFPVDYWSLGIMIYEMIVLNTPFYHSNLNDIKNHVIHGDFHCPDHISPDLREIVSGLLRKNPQERFGINELQSSRFYSSTIYSLEQIEKGNLICPWKRPV